jgi:ligand-binding sensor domain-containing protein
MKSIPLLLCLFSMLLLKAQSTVSGFRHFNSDDGLPSSEVYEIIQDSKGYLWFGTDNGLSRFNGYSFRNFGALHGLSDPVVFHLQEDRHGRIWMQCISGKLFYFENDSIHAFTGNTHLKALLDGSPGTSKGFYIDSTDHIHCSLLNLGLIRFSPQGEMTILKKDLYSVSVYQIDKMLLSVFCFQNNQRDTALRIYQYWKEKQILPVSFERDNHKSTLYLSMEERTGEPESFLLQDGSMLFSVFDNFFRIRNDKVVWQKHFPFKILSWHQSTTGEIFIGLNQQKPLGVRRYTTISDIPANNFTTLLEGYTVSHILEDREGGFWFATTEDGVFYQPNPRMKIFNRGSGVPDDHVTSVAIKNDRECFAGFDGAGIFHIDLSNGTVKPLPPAGGRIFDLAYDQRDDILWAATADVLYLPLQQGKWQRLMDVTQSESQKRPIPLYSKHFHFSPDKQDIWSANHFGFFNIHTGNKSIGTYSLNVQINGAVYASRTFDVLVARTGHTWVANMNGLYELKDRQLIPAPPLHPAFGVRVEALAELPDGTLVIGSKGYGLVFWKGDQVASLSEQDGLTSNMIANLLADEEGRLWAGTFNGLNRIIWKWGKNADLRTITKAQGLPDNGIADVAVRGNNIWVATDEGLAFFAELPPVITLAPAPVIEKILVNDKRYNPGKLMNLSYLENNLTIHFVSLQYRNAPGIRYRYRLKPSDKWYYTREHQLNFAALAPGNYFFEVQAQNAENQWSAPVLQSFVIHPPWWTAWWFLSGMAVLVGAAGYGLYRYRMQELRKNISLERQLSDLERKALQAQMSPHFIFNCLNSLQLLIMQNERDKALHYMGIFANLVRGILNASIRGILSIQDEIDLLTNYLTMEKLRFKEKFDFEIQTAPGLNMMKRAIPPMLIQPYVENALLHGMQGKTTGGLVTISFDHEGAHLIVTITDNGTGIGAYGKPPTAPKENVHKSVGMMLTRKRLELIHGGRDEKLVQVETLKTEDGLIIGTRIRVMIKTEAEPGFTGR